MQFLIQTLENPLEFRKYPDLSLSKNAKCSWGLSLKNEEIFCFPDLVVCADKFDPFVTEHSGCTIVNPGSFAKNDFSFKTYMLKTKQIEDSQIPDDE